MANPWDNDPVIESPAAAPPASAAPWDADPIISQRGQMESVPGASVTDGMSAYERFMAGAGKSVADSALGASQVLSSPIAPLLNPVGGAITYAIGQRNAIPEKLEQQVSEQRKLDAPLMDTAAGIGGNVAGQIAQMAIPGGGVSTRLGRAAPFVESALRSGAFAAAQPLTEDQSRGKEAGKGAAWGLAGQGIASGLSKAATAAKQSLTPVVQESIEAARRAGIPLHLSQVTDSRFLKALSSVLNTMPLTGAAKAARGQQEAFNRAVGRTFGVDAPQLSDDVIKAARQGIGDVYNNVFARNNVSLQQGDLARMAAIEKAALKDISGSESGVVQNQFQKIIDDFANGPITGSKYQSLRESLRGAMDESKTGKAVAALRKALDEAAYRSVGSSDASLLKQANSMWANMRTAEKALAQVSGAGGNIKPASLYPLIRDGGTKEMRELAKVGQNVLKDGIPNSGSPERQFIQNFLGALAGAGGYATGTVPTVVGTLAAGSALGRLMNSPAAARALGQGAPMNALARLAQPAPKALPALAGNGLIPYLTGDASSEPQVSDSAASSRKKGKSGR